MSCYSPNDSVSPTSECHFHHVDGDAILQSYNSTTTLQSDTHLGQFVSHWYQYLLVDLADPRTSEWWLMGSPWPGGGILVAYLLFVLHFGPKWMKNRKPWQMKNLLVVYNFAQVLLSTWIFYEALDACWLYRYSWRCEPVDYSYSPHALRVARGVYIYFLAKMTELLDTVFFVLRKKNSQITFLHVYHHFGMAFISWCCAKYFPGGHATFIGLVNAFVHIIMYIYYALAAFGPQIQKYLWWKKYITTIQLTQFCITFLHSSQLLFYDCGYPKFTLLLTLPNAVFFFYLFFDFYKKTYTEKRRSEDALKCNGHVKTK